ncbi:MAG: thymidine kinase [Bacteroidia bacterium]|nr:thymidine kinase [Bacteroidia bacterium]MDW8347154.1 thymidine kinase [Bacteroidia bacterium]
MFIEPIHYHSGWIEVICGSMFSGKTEELIRRLRRSLIAKQKVEIFKPMVDNRYSVDSIVSHNDNEIRCTPIQNSQELFLLGQGIQVVGIDEAQFFDSGLIDAVQYLANNGVRVIIAGLDQDYKGRPFGIMPSLMAIAEYVTKVHAICAVCGNVANHSYRIHQQDKNIVLIGDKDLYEPRCRKCFFGAVK